MGAPKKGTISLTTPKREPLPRTWFLSHGYKKADPAYSNGRVLWLHPETNDVLNQYGQRIPLRTMPYEKFKPNTTRYLVFNAGCYGSMYLARLKYLTFKGVITKGYTIDHIDGNPLNNSIGNLRAVPPEINSRDGGFMRKLRNHGINVAMYPGIILEGYERMAKWKDSHNNWQYARLTRTELLQIFLGPDFRIDPRSTDDIMRDEMSHHREI